VVSNTAKSPSISICIATYGSDDWRELAWSRAWPSCQDQGALEVLVFHDPDGTIASVRNELASTAKGDALIYCDADDELAPGYLDAMTRAVERVGDGPALLTPAVSQVRKGKAGAPFFFDRGIPLSQDNWLVVGTLIQRNLFLEVDGFSDYPHGFEDWSLWAKAWKAGAQIIKVPDAIYRYHVNPQSKHKRGWRNRKWQVATHMRVVAELEAWERSRA